MATKLKKWQFWTLISSSAVILGLIIAIIVCSVIRTSLLPFPINTVLNADTVRTQSFYNKEWADNVGRPVTDTTVLTKMIELIKSDANTTVLDSVLTGRNKNNLKEVDWIGSAITESDAYRNNDYVIKLNLLVLPQYKTNVSEFPFYLRNNDGTPYVHISSTSKVLYDQILILVNKGETGKITLAFNGRVTGNTGTYEPISNFQYTQVIEGYFSNLIKYLGELEETDLGQ